MHSHHEIHTDGRIVLNASSLLLVGACCWSVSAAGQNAARELEYECMNGSTRACNILYNLAQQECMNGNTNACNYAADMARAFGQGEPRYPGAVQSPLAPYRGTVNEATDYINSKCSDPKLAAQLQAFGFCNR